MLKILMVIARHLILMGAQTVIGKIKSLLAPWRMHTMKATGEQTYGLSEPDGILQR